MRAWLFQDPRQKAKLGDKCPWCVGWIDPDGKRRSKKCGSRSTAGKYARQVEGELAARLLKSSKRMKWTEFRQRFAEVALAAKSSGTHCEYNKALNNFERVIRPVYLDTITTETMDLYATKRRKESKRTTAKEPGDAPRKLVSPATVNKELRHLRAAFRKAASWGRLDKAPAVALLSEPQRDPYFIDDGTFAKLYDACDAMTRPAGRRYPAADWWRALLCFAYMTGWRIGEILDLRRDDLDLENGIATVDAESTKGRRTARVELHSVVMDHVRAIVEFQPLVFDWPHHERTLWTDFTALKAAAGVDFPGAFHRFRFGFANANVDSLDADLLQRLMRHQSAATTRHYINVAERMKRSGVADRLHVPAILKPGATG